MSPHLPLYGAAETSSDANKTMEPGTETRRSGDSRDSLRIARISFTSLFACFARQMPIPTVNFEQSFATLT